MNASGPASRLIVGLTVVVLFARCTAGAAPIPLSTSADSSTSPAEAAATSPRTATVTAAPTPSVVVTTDVPYEAADTLPMPALLDVYAPARTGQWPVVVMFHGFEGSKVDLSVHARKVADLGFVVFVPTWNSSMPTIGGANRVAFSQAACAVAFARMQAAEYGGDPATMIVFGHSAGAHPAAMVAFARPEPAAGCLGGAELGAIDALVTWEGNWLLSATEPTVMDWDGTLAADPRILDTVTPWRYLAGHKDLKVVMLVSEHPGAFFEREVGDPWAADSWLAVRDRSGFLRQQLQSIGAFGDGKLDFVEVQQLLFSVLRGQGNPVSLDVMPGSSHDSLSDVGWKVFLDAFPKAAKRG